MGRRLDALATTPMQFSDVVFGVAWFVGGTGERREHG